VGGEGEGEGEGDGMRVRVRVEMGGGGEGEDVRGSGVVEMGRLRSSTGEMSAGSR
jgi:hypothetical protein